MDDAEDDNWVRLFDVSNPQKTHAGYTVYRVSSKVYPKGFPEAASEVIVFKRYSEIRALYKDLKIIYESKSGQNKHFPHLAKAHFFSRFDESVIEERQKQALMLLNFAGNIYFLFTSQPFVKFFEGGVEHASRASSRNSSDSDQPFDPEEATEPDYCEMQAWTPQSYFTNNGENSELNSSDEETTEPRNDPTDPNLTLDLKNDNVCSSPIDSSKINWLARAMSMCSEGDDIETLASEAGCGENELNKPKDSPEILEAHEPQDVPAESSQTSQGNVLDLLPTLLESSEGEDDEDVFVEILSNDKPQPCQPTGNNKDVQEEYVYAKDLTDEKSHPTDNTRYSGEHNNVTKVQKTQENNRVEENIAPEKSKKGLQQVGRLVSNIGVSWIDPRKKDYLYEAAQIIQQALYCEANEMYEDAFNKYKICVGILLKGVQHDSNSKRRDAVRRKTAQYLLKAEFLVNTYLKMEDGSMSDLTVNPPNASKALQVENLCNRQFSQLTLKSLKVIGVIRKVMLVQCRDLEGVFVVKVLHKTNAVHRNVRHENKQTNKGFSKKYINSAHMVKLYRHFDTSNSIFLLLDYAIGGTLWNYVNTLREQSKVTEQTSEQEIKEDVTSSEYIREDIEHTRGTKTNLVPPDNLGNSESDALTSSNDLCQTSGATCLVNKRSTDKETKIKTSKGKEHFDENLAGLSDPDGMFRTIDNLSIDKTDLNTTTLSSETEKNCIVDNQDHATTCGDVLHDLDHVTQGDHVTAECIQRWIAELLVAMVSVHSCGIIFKDLKPANVLLDDSGHVLLSYFGVWEEVDHSVDPEAVEHLYCAPEISCGEKITFAADWWSLGVLSYELITGRSFSSTHPWGIHSHSSINFPTDDISAEARSFLTELICHNSGERLGSGMDGVEEIKTHAFFKGIDWHKIATRS